MLPLGKIELLLQENGWIVTNDLLDELITLITQLEEVLSIGSITTISEISLRLPTLTSLKYVLGFYPFNYKRVILALEIRFTFQERFLVYYNILTPIGSLTIRSGRVFLSYEEMVFLLFIYLLTSLGFRGFEHTSEVTKEKLDELNNLTLVFYQFLRP